MEKVNTLDGMTFERWISLSSAERDRIRDNSALTPQLIGLEGWRVEVTIGDRRYRFIVGKSTGWMPIHLEIFRRSSHGGEPAEKRYDTIRKIENVRGR